MNLRLVAGVLCAFRYAPGATGAVVQWIVAA